MHHSRFPSTAVTAVLLFSALTLTPGTHAQEWHGSLGVGYQWLNSSGSSDAFRTQYNLDEGFFLEDATLDFRGEGGLSRLHFDAWGFGDAMPAESFRLGLDFAGGFRFDLRYSKNESFFGLAGGDLADRSDRWDLTRWSGLLAYEGWENWTLQLELRTVDRSGTVHRPAYGLNELYPLGVDLDETMNEASFLVESRAWPVHLAFEQSFASYTRANRPFVAGAHALSNPNDPDLLVGVGSSGEDTQEIPTSRLTASWGNHRWEGVASVMYSKADLDTAGTVYESYDIGGGATGNLSFIDDLVGSTEMDTTSAALRLGFSLSRAWTLRLSGSYRDAAADSSLLGRRLLRTVNPAGTDFELEGAIGNSGLYEFTDSDARLTIEWQGKAWRLWAGGTAAARDVQWRRTDDGETIDVNRDLGGYVAGIGWSPSSQVDATVEYEGGSFESYVFRTDPEKVNRVTGKLRAQLGKGWSLNVHGRCDRGENPAEVADLDRKTGAYGAGLAWASSDGGDGFAFTLDRVDLESNTDLILPDGETAVSIYDLDLTTLTLSGRTELGIVGLDISATYMTDSGATWPVDAWNAGARLSIAGPARTRFALFAQYWEYDEGSSDLDDFDATRYGASIHWSF